jgi:hypothetical protein
MEKTKELKGQIGTDFAGWAGSAAGKDTLNEMYSKSHAHGQLYQLGGGGMATPTTAQGFLDTYSKLSEITSPDHSSPYQITLTPYYSLDYPQSQGPGMRAINLMANQYERLTALDLIMNEMERNPDMYWWDRKISLSIVKGAQTKLRADQELLFQLLQNCSKAPEQCEYPKTVEAYDYVYREQLPMPRSMTEEAAQFDALVLKRDAAKAVLDATPENTPIISDLQPPPVIHNPQYDVAKENYVAATARLQDFMTTADSTEERYRLWIEVPALARCDFSEKNGKTEAEVCLSVDQLASFHRDILQ